MRVLGFRVYTVGVSGFWGVGGWASGFRGLLRRFKASHRSFLDGFDASGGF